MDKNNEAYLKKKLCVLSMDLRKSIKVGNRFKIDDIVNELELYSKEISYIQEIYYKLIKYISFYQFKNSELLTSLIQLIDTKENINIDVMKKLYSSLLSENVSEKIKYSNKLWKMSLNIDFEKNYFSSYISSIHFKKISPIDEKYENLIPLLKSKNINHLSEIFIYTLYLIYINKIDLLMKIFSNFLSPTIFKIFQNVYLKTKDITYFYVMIMKIMTS